MRIQNGYDGHIGFSTWLKHGGGGRWPVVPLLCIPGHVVSISQTF